MQMKSYIAGFVLLMVAMTAVYAQDYMLYVEQSPADGGSVSPGAGKVHSYQSGQQVSVSAVPAQGYQFLYWLGAVSDTASATTSVSVDGPRYLVAVFERTQFDEPMTLSTTYAGAGSNQGSGLIRSRGFNPGTLSSPSSSSYEGPTYNYPDYTPEDKDPELPIPETPEPATMLMLAAGSLGILMKRKQK